MNRPEQAHETTQPSPPPVPALIVESCYGDPSGTAGKQGSASGPLPESEGVPGGLLRIPDKGRTWQNTPGWLDRKYHAELAAKYLPQFDMPAWDKPCEPEAMERWLHRLGFEVKEYLRDCGMNSLADFAELNPRWSLRAWLQTILEMRHERSCTQWPG